MEADNEMDSLRARFLAAALPFVARRGWLCLDMGLCAEKAGLSLDEARLLFPSGAAAGEMADFFLRQGDRQMHENAQKTEMPSAMRARIGHLIWLRLAADRENKEALRRTIALFMLPAYWPRGAACLARISDEIWRLAGDESADFSYYSKRALLAGIFSESLTVFLSQRGDDEAYVQSFIARRIDNLMKLAALLRGEFNAKKKPPPPPPSPPRQVETDA